MGPDVRAGEADLPALEGEIVSTKDVMAYAGPDLVNTMVLSAETHGPTYEAIRKLEAAIPAVLPAIAIDDITAHHFCEGMYCREMFMPKGSVVVGKVHRDESFFLVVKGDITVLTESGKIQRVRSPFLSVTKPGTKRVGFSHEDSTVLNIHANPTNEQDVAALEVKYIFPEAVPTLPEAEMKHLLEGITQ